MQPVQISFFGATNSGKSTLVNTLAGQSVSLVSELPGTTTDPVRKRMELPGIGPVILVDTAGYGDSSALGAQRERLTQAVIDTTDVAVLLLSGHPADARWQALLEDAGVPVVTLDKRRQAIPEGVSVAIVQAQAQAQAQAQSQAQAQVQAWSGGLDSLLKRIAELIPQEEKRFLTGSLVQEGDTVILVMPQDSEAPKGRIILPQVQVLRELLDRGCIPVCCTPEHLPGALDALGARPRLVITDSQVFAAVNAALGADIPLTSFSVLLAAAKGDIRVFVEGARAIDRLQPGDRVLIAEACTHVPDTEDIGRVKIPALLRQKAPVQVDIAAGNDFPEDLGAYSLIIHCGACMSQASLVKARIRKALRAGVPITNYGIALAHLQGILERIAIP